MLAAMSSRTAAVASDKKVHKEKGRKLAKPRKTDDGYNGSVEGSPDLDTAVPVPAEVTESKDKKKTPTGDKGLRHKLDLEAIIGSFDSTVPDHVKDRDRRERKTVQRYESPEVDKTAVVIEPGNGIKLGEIAHISNQINDPKKVVDHFKTLHTFLFGRSAVKMQVKKNIRQFSGFPFAAESEQYKSRKDMLLKFTPIELEKICGFLGLREGWVVDDILDFCMNPGDIKGTANAKTPVAKPGSKSAKRKALALTPESDDKDSPARKKRYLVFENPDEKKVASGSEKQKKVQFYPPKKFDQKETSDESETGAETESDTDKKKPSKANTKSIANKAKAGTVQGKKNPRTAKSRQAQSNKATNDEEDTDDQVVEAEGVTDEQLEDTVRQVIEDSDLRNLSMKKAVEKVFSAYPNVDLNLKRDMIKNMIEKAIMDETV